MKMNIFQILSVSTYLLLVRGERFNVTCNANGPRLFRFKVNGGRMVRFNETHPPADHAYCKNIIIENDFGILRVENGFFDDVTGIEKLMIKNNQLTAWDYSGSVLNQLTSINLESNEIENLGPLATAFPKLQQLNMADNYLHELTRVQFEGLTDLMVVNFNYNQITEIDDTTFDASSLREITINFNLLDEVERAFIGNGISKLMLSDNEIESVDYDSFPPNLKELILRNNRLIEIPENLKIPQLTKLDLYGNNLDSFPNLTDASQLQSVNLEGNTVLCCQVESLTGATVTCEEGTQELQDTECNNNNQEEEQSQNNGSSNSGISTTTIIIIAVCSVAGIGIFFAIIAFVCYRGKAKKFKKTSKEEKGEDNSIDLLNGMSAQEFVMDGGRGEADKIVLYSDTEYAEIQSGVVKENNNLPEVTAPEPNVYESPEYESTGNISTLETKATKPLPAPGADMMTSVRAVQTAGGKQNWLNTIQTQQDEYSFPENDQCSDDDVNPDNVVNIRKSVSKNYIDTGGAELELPTNTGEEYYIPEPILEYEAVETDISEYVIPNL